MLIRLKAQDLASYILAKRTELDFGEPRSILPRNDSEAIRSRILSLTTADARRLGIRRNTLWYLQEHAKTGESFGIYGKVMAKLSQTN